MAKAAIWEDSYRFATGAAPPVLVARGLRDPNRAARIRAVLLLAKETPFPRELLSVVIERPWGPGI